MVGTFDEVITERIDLTSIQKQNLPSNYGMHVEILRLASFKTWPRWAPIQPNRLSRAGFYYLGTNDEVECFACNGKVKQWHHGDKPNDRHRRVNPQCTFLLGSDTTNIALPRPAHARDSPEGVEGIVT